jgi:hypothetical protein
MSLTETKDALSRDFVTCVEQDKIPPLGDYLPDYVKSGCSVEPADFRLVPISTTSRRFLNTSSDCVTDCMIELQCKYEQFVPDDWGGRMERGWRDIGVIGFNMIEGNSLEIQEINETKCHVDWAQPKLASLDWERLLIHAVIDFGRYCKAAQIRLLPAHRCYPGEALAGSTPESTAEFQQQMKQRYDGSAEASGFAYDEATDSFVVDVV